MKNNLLLLVLLVFISFSCRTRKVDKQEDKSSVQQSAQSETKETAEEKQTVNTETQETDKSGTLIIDEVFIKKGKDTLEIRRTTTRLWNDINKGLKEYKTAVKESTSQNKQATQKKEKQLKQTVQKVVTGVPWWVYLLSGVAVVGTILLVIKLKFF